MSLFFIDFRIEVVINSVILSEFQILLIIPF